MKNIICISCLLLLAYISKAQNVGINNAGTSPHASAMLDIDSPDKGLLIPRLDTSAISGPATGLMIFQPSDNGFYFYNGTKWALMGTVANLLTDQDGDTSVNPEVTPDSDEIIFKINGVETFKMDSTTLAFINTNNNTSVGNMAGRDLTSGGHNTLIGRDAGTNVENGDHNVAVGSAALVNTINGEFNVAVGRRALRKNVVSDFNTGIGHEAGEENLATGNTAVGALSLQKTTNGQHNSAFGMQSLWRNSNGSYNVAAGYCSSADSIKGNYNTSSGSFSLFRLRNGSENTAIGGHAGELLINGSKNIFIGSHAGGNNFLNTSNRLYIDVENVNQPLIYGEFDNNKIQINGDLTATETLTLPLGAQQDYVATTDSNGVVSWTDPSTIQSAVDSLIADSDGDTGVNVEVTPDSDEIIFTINGIETFKMDSTTLSFMNTNNNTSVGNFAGSSLTSGGFNSFYGRDAGQKTSGGNHNSAFGYRAFRENTFGFSNVAIGRSALQNNTGGSSNTAVGSQAGEQNQGSSNTIVGSQALTANTFGGLNTVVGALSMINTTFGKENATLGYLSISSLVEGDYNVGIGAFSLADLDDSDGNVALGYNAGGELMNGNRNLFLGYNAGPTSGAVTRNDQLFIHSSQSNIPLIYGEFDNRKAVINGDLTVTDSLVVPSGAVNGYIATSDINGVVSWADPDTLISHVWSEIGDTIVYVDDSVEVGIGTSSPNADLEIVAAPMTIASQIIRSNQDVNLMLLADENNIGERDNPLITMLQDGGSVGVYMGFENDSIGANVFGIGTRNNMGTNVWDAFTIDTETNNIGMGITNATHPLQMGGGAFCEDGETWVDASDRRLKTQIFDLNYGLNDVMKLRPVNYISKSNKRANIGFIAQEIREVIPEVVMGVEGDLEKGETLGLSYSHLTALLVKGMQEQQQEIQDLKNEIKSQNDKMNKLEELVSNFINNN